jgi:O-antigen ligase
MPSGSFFTTRFPVWGAGISYLKGQPWFGLGLGSWLRTAFVTVGANGAQEQWTWAHNDFLQWGYEVGIAGVIMLWLWIKNLFVNQRNRLLIGAFSTLCIIAFFHFPFHIARLAGLGCFIIACLEAQRSEAIYA